MIDSRIMPTCAVYKTHKCTRSQIVTTENSSLCHVNSAKEGGSDAELVNDVRLLGNSIT